MWYTKEQLERSKRMFELGDVMLRAIRDASLPDEEHDLALGGMMIAMVKLAMYTATERAWLFGALENMYDQFEAARAAGERH